MDYNRAKELKESLIFDIMYRGKGNSAIPIKPENDLLKNAMRRSVNGVGLVKKGEAGYLLKLFTKHPLDAARVARLLDIPVEELIVCVAGRISMQASPVLLVSGCSIGHFDVRGGSFACYVKDNNEKIHLLSNNHVLANLGHGTIGDPVLHPCVKDGGTILANVVGHLSKFVPIVLGSEHINYVDCAMAEAVSQKVTQIGLPLVGVVRGVTAPDYDKEVVKNGMGSNLTTGRINTMEAYVIVEYGRLEAHFDNQFEIESEIPGGSFSEVGDSGSLIVERESVKAVGLLFSGNPETRVTFANPIEKVLTELEVGLL
jgi:hypothetical protein